MEQTLFTVKDLSILFNMHERKVEYNLRMIAPDEMRFNRKLYHVHTVAHKLVEVDEDQVMERLLELKPKDMPPQLTRAYWSAKRMQQEYELRDGILWETVVVQQKVTQMFLLIRQHIRMVVDMIERRTELTELQRTILTNSMDGLLKDLQISILETFSSKTKMRLDEEELFS
jgi:hypothetical protein